jgi:hypothetical protein
MKEKSKSKIYIILYFEWENYTPVEKKRKQRKTDGV